MKIGIVSDIHGNVEALMRFIEYMDNKGIERVLNLGDTLGGEDPLGALRIIREDKRFISVLGNHDEALEFIEEDMTAEDKQYVYSLKKSEIIEIDGRKFLMIHSRVDSNKDIPLLYNGGTLEGFFEDYEGEYDFVLFGHTHYQCLLSYYYGKIIINPGSLGLSYDEKISFCVLDLSKEDFKVEFKKI